MKKNFLLLLISFALLKKSNCQITKGNWLVRGSARIEKQHETLRGTPVLGSSISATPDVGYFIFDKFAAGAEIEYSGATIKQNGHKSTSNYLAFGPYLRYYWLSEDHVINLFSQALVDYGVDFNGHNAFDYLFSSGAVLFFNTSVGLELTGNYSISNTGIDGLNNKTAFLQLGFQIHLEKPDNN
jgi:hypothetical protein